LGQILVPELLWIPLFEPLLRQKQLERGLPNGTSEHWMGGLKIAVIMPFQQLSILTKLFCRAIFLAPTIASCTMLTL
jgi:hypothetical protein